MPHAKSFKNQLPGLSKIRLDTSIKWKNSNFLDFGLGFGVKKTNCFPWNLTHICVRAHWSYKNALVKVSSSGVLKNRLKSLENIKSAIFLLI